MPGFFAPLVVGIFFGVFVASAQTPQSSNTGKIETPTPVPTLKEGSQSQRTAPKNTHRHDFLKNLTVQSFGYSAAPTGQGFEFPERFSNGSSTAHNLQCPYCLIWPNTARSRYTLPAFGAQTNLKLWRDRTELFAEFGGINAWKPDNSLIDLTRPRGTSFNDAWLLQGVAGARVASTQAATCGSEAPPVTFPISAKAANTGTPSPAAPLSTSVVKLQTSPCRPL